MCGITGTYNFKRCHLQTAYTWQCLHSMQHRGPDAQNVWDNGENYVAGFVRLAIRDTSANGNQPMLSEDKNYCISFNGEIYNTAVLIQKLKPYRSSFISSSDTEVLLYALIHLGIEETLLLADGMFAFAFYAVQQNTLILARDRAGIKPLYIGKSSQGIVYSSQYDHVINHPFIRNEVFDERAIATYLLLGYMPENSGVINNTFLLPHGNYAVITYNAFDVYTYYTYNSANGTDHTAIDDEMGNAVLRQLVSDVPVGTFMSGGVDSTLVSYYANQHLKLKAFTIGVHDAAMDEVAAAKTFAGAFQLDHHFRYITAKDILQLVTANAKAFTEPFADYSSLPTLLLSQFAKSEVTVALSGDGGDELFWGYARNRKALQHLPFYRNSSLQRKAGILYNKIKSPAVTDVARHWNQDNFIDYYYSALFITGASYWLPKVYKAKPQLPYFYHQSKALYNNRLSDTDCMQIVRKMEVDLHLQRILLKVDRASMYHSLEVRVPLLSNAMLHYSQSFTYKDCINGGQGKMLLKNTLMNKVNNPLVLQPKKGFVVPVDAWLRNELKKEVSEKIMDMPATLAGAFDKKALSKMLHRHANGEGNFGWFIWAVYSLVAWYENHVHKSGAPACSPAYYGNML